MNKLLSICIPTYNRGKRLNRTLNNLLKILEGLDNKSIEIIVSDNNSVDETPELVNNYKDKIIYYRQKSNLGYDGNIKFLYTVAKGEFIYFLADDDEVVGDKFVELFNIILRNKNGSIECYLVNFFEGNNQLDRYDYINYGTNIITMNAIGLNFYKPFVFLSGFVLKNKNIDLQNIDTGTYFAQMDIALSSLCKSSELYVYRDYVVRRVIPHYEDETGCNIMDDTWKIYFGSAKIRRKHEGKFNIRSPYFLEVNQLISFSRNYIKLPNRSWDKKIKIVFLAFSKLQNKYKIRMIFLPILVFNKIIKKKIK